MTVARIWRTSVAANRADEYERFARNISLPMFRSQPGFQGVLMLRRAADCLVVSLWTDEEAVAALDHSPAYRATVQNIKSQGFLVGEQSTDLFSLHVSCLH